MFTAPHLVYLLDNIEPTTIQKAFVKSASGQRLNFKHINAFKTAFSTPEKENQLEFTGIILALFKRSRSRLTQPGYCKLKDIIK